MKNTQGAKYRDKIVPQFLIMAISVVVVAAMGYFFMTWLVNDVFNVEGTYIRVPVISVIKYDEVL